MAETKKMNGKKWFRSLARHRLLMVLLILIQFVALIFLLINRSTVSKITQYILSVISVLTALHIIARRSKSAYKLTWVFLILLFPVFGGLLYLLFRYQMRSKKLRQKMNAVNEQTKEAFFFGGEAYGHAVAATPERIRQIDYLEHFAGFPIYENTKVTYLPRGEDFWHALLAALETAEHYIFLEFYIIQEGAMWDAILGILKKKAAAGVDVRVIYDDVGCFLRLPKNYPNTLRSYGIRCVVYSRFRPIIVATQNNRDHRKIVAIDGKIAFTGGSNLSDEYINITHPFGHWKDTAVRLDGIGAWSLTLIFLQMWLLTGHTEENFGVYYPWKEGAVPVLPESGFVLPYADAPFDEENVCEHVYMQLIQSAKKYLYITTPYLIMDDSMISAFILAAKSGVDIRIITPSHWDKRFVHFTTRSYYRELIKAGVRIFEYTPGFIHAKMFVSDDTVATVGSANMDFRSMYLQFEAGVWMTGCSAVTAVRDDIEGILPQCREIFEKDCRYHTLTRFIQDVCRLFAPLM